MTSFVLTAQRFDGDDLSEDSVVDRLDPPPSLIAGYALVLQRGRACAHPIERRRGGWMRKQRGTQRPPSSPFPTVLTCINLSLAGDLENQGTR